MTYWYSDINILSCCFTIVQKATMCNWVRKAAFQEHWNHCFILLIPFSINVQVQMITAVISTTVVPLRFKHAAYKLCTGNTVLFFFAVIFFFAIVGFSLWFRASVSLWPVGCRRHVCSLRCLVYRQTKNTVTVERQDIFLRNYCDRNRKCINL